MVLKKYPFVKQSGLKDCGVSCLQMIIKFYQGYVGTRQLQEMTKTTKNGTTAFHLIEAAKEIGFEAKGVKAKLSDINEQNMILPCIANVTINNTYNHYMVVYKIDYKNLNLVIADPSSNIRKMSFEDFDKIWNNVFLFMYPIKTIPLNNNQEIKPHKYILKILFSSKKLFLNSIVVSIFYSLFSIISSYYFKFIGDSFINQSKDYLLFVFIIFLSFSILKLISDLFRNQLLVHFNEKIELILTNNIFRNIILLPYNYYRNHTTGEIVSRIDDLSRVREMISKSILVLFIDLPLAIFSCILLYFISETLFFIAIIILLFYLLIMIIFTPIFSNHINTVQQKKADYTSYMIESITGFESVKGMGMEKEIIDKFENKFIKFLKKIFNFETLYNNQHFISTFICDIGTVVIIFIGSLLIFDNKLTIGGLLLFNSLFNYFLYPFKNTLELTILFKEANNALKRVFEILTPNEDNGIFNNISVGKIDFQNLNYSYNDREMILKNINLSILPQDKIMIIGNSGSGKSTLVKLLLQYYKINRNQIKIDDIDINDYKASCLKDNITYISQNETLFTDTLYNNIVLNKKINDQKFLEIVKLCFIDDIIKNNNLGYSMLIEENGFNLSGGEKQRIVLARALLKNSKILIIDEGLNQMDISLERKIIKNILKVYSDKTILVISHRLDNMDLFNRVIEFSNHKIKRDVRKNG